MSNYEKFLKKSDFQKMKVVQYEDIPIVKDMECPNCHMSDVFEFAPCVRAKPIGWCETQQGFMGVFECPKCFQKFRCHINSTGRYYIEQFYEDFALDYFRFTRKR